MLPLSSSTADLADFIQITKSCERLVNKTQADLETCKNEQEQLRSEIVHILEENTRAITKLDDLKITSSTFEPAESKDDATRALLCGDAEINLKKQIDYLKAENRELHSLNKSSKKHIQNLELEIQNYRNQLFKHSSISEVKQKYDTAIRLLENTIKNQKTELEKQAQVVENLFDQKQKCTHRIAALQAAISEMTRANKEKECSNETVAKLQLQLQKSARQNKEQLKSLQQTKLVIEERFDREKRALQKVQEALSIAESAVADKEEALKREQIVKEECEHLAYTIGQVMDEAAQKVETDMKSLRHKFADRENFLLEQQQKLKEEIKNQREIIQAWDTRCNRFEQKYKEVCMENEKLKGRLLVATKTLDIMKLKLEVNSNQLKVDQTTLRRADEQEQQIQNYIKTNKEVKDKYKAIINDTTNKFEHEIYRLETINANLRTENQFLRIHINNSLAQGTICHNKE